MWLESETKELGAYQGVSSTIKMAHAGGGAVLGGKIFTWGQVVHKASKEHTDRASRRVPVQSGLECREQGNTFRSIWTSVTVYRR